MNKLKEFDNNIYKTHKTILGIDEVGRGCIAGPLVVAGVILKKDFFDNQIKDSKKILSIEKRKELSNLIKQNAINYSIKIFEPSFVDDNNPKKTSQLGMLQIAKELIGLYDICITDYEKISLNINQLNLTKGDMTSFSVACASIIAKSTRDEIMCLLNKQYPSYDFINNQGYSTKKHMEELKKSGPIKNVHRFSYKNVRKYNE